MGLGVRVLATHRRAGTLRGRAVSKGGAPSKFRSEYVEVARNLCEMGAIDVEVAKALGVHKVTLYRWCAEHPEFSEAMQVGKEPANRRLLLAFMRKACGYEFKEEIVTYDSKRGQYARTTVTKHVPPDTAALIFGLKNRLGWRDRVDHEHTGKDGSPIQVEHMTQEEVDRELAKLLAKVDLSSLLAGKGGQSH